MKDLGGSQLAETLNRRPVLRRPIPELVLLVRFELPPGAHHRRRPFHAVAPHQPRPGLDEGTKEYEAALLWIRLFRSLDAIVGGQDASARAWLSSPNLAFAGQRPRDLIVGTEGLVRVVQYLDAHRAKL